MHPRQPDHYAALGVNPDSTFGLIQKAFFQISLSCHPDKRDKSEFEQAHKEFALISAAYNVLKDPDSRRKYDNTRRARRTQRAGTSQKRNSNGDHPSYNQSSGDEDTSEPRATQFPGNPRFYAEQSERNARQKQHTRHANQEHPGKWETESDTTDSEGTDDSSNFQAYEVPRHEEVEEFSPEQEAWLKYRTAKNNLQGLSFSLSDAVYRVLEVIRSLRKVDSVKRRASKARVQLRFIETSFSNIQEEMDSVHSPVSLTEATAIRINKMMILGENIQDFLGLLGPRMPGLAPPEQEAMETSKLLLKAMSQWVQLCK
ncbi:hypothetical protein F5883DRAFT_643688 [Diaporthe sp. PMI_573]|nr:hypothetical protein F5883DRAFT_643688 [Diaporthaceae sp. PMI_573]